MHNTQLQPVLTNDEKNTLRTRIAERGLSKVASEIGIARATVGRQLADLDGHRASTIAVRVYLSQLV
jgi:DNA-binding phage protein